MCVPERKAERLKHLEVSPAQDAQHPQFGPMKFRQVERSSRGKHAPCLTQRPPFQVVWQLMQQEKYHVDVDRTVLLFHLRGIVFDEIHFPGKLAKLALCVNKFIVNDILNQDRLCTGLYCSRHDSGNDVSECAGGDQHLLVAQVRLLQSGNDLRYQTMILKQENS